MTSPAPTASRIGPAIGVVGLGAAATGFFALPIQAYAFNRGQDVGFVQVRQLAGYLADHPIKGQDSPIGGLARFWWQWGLLLAGVVLVGLVAAAVLSRAPALGWVLAGVAVLTGVLHGIALHQTSDYFSLVRALRARGSLFDHAGAGPVVAFVGLGVLLVGGVLSALLGRARPAAPPPPQPVPA